MRECARVLRNRLIFWLLINTIEGWGFYTKIENYSGYWMTHHNILERLSDYG